MANQLFNLSQKSNDYQSTVVPPRHIEARKQVRVRPSQAGKPKYANGLNGAPWEARTPKPDEANSRDYVTYHLRPYATGDGDTLSIRRPGSDHSHLKSAGTLC